MAASYIVQEADGTSKFTLENGSGALLTEDSSGSGGGTSTIRVLKRRRS